jgi:hypothetical protein
LYLHKKIKIKNKNKTCIQSKLKNKKNSNNEVHLKICMNRNIIDKKPHKQIIEKTKEKKFKNNYKKLYMYLIDNNVCPHLHIIKHKINK